MGAYEFVFIVGLLIGFFIGLWLGGRFVLSRMHKDDVESAHANYRKRKDKYLGKE